MTATDRIAAGSDSRASEPARGERRTVWLLLWLLVIVYQIYAADGFATIVDLHVTDEALYFENGARVMRGSGDWRKLVSWSGPYQVLYGLVGLIEMETPAQDVMRWFLCIASTTALFWAVSGLAKPLPTTAAAILWSSGAAYVGGGNGVYLCGAALAFGAVGCLFRQQVLAGAILGLLAASARPELAIWTGGVGVVAIVLGSRALGATLIAAAVALMALQGAVDTGGRSAMAFRQHYALGAAQEQLREAGGIVTFENDPTRAFERPDEWMRSSFGDATSLPTALGANPAEVGRHVLRNLRELPGRICEVANRFPGSRPIGIGTSILLLSLAAIGLVGSLGFPWRGRPMRQEMEFWPAALVLSTPALAVTSIVFGPRGDYLICGFLPLLLLVAHGLRSLGALQPAWQGRGGSTGRRMVAAAAILALLPQIPRAPDTPEVRPLRWREILAAAKHLGGSFLVVADPGGASALLEDGDRLIEIGRRGSEEVSRLLVHHSDLTLFSLQALPQAEDSHLREIWGRGDWHLEAYLGGVLLLARPLE